MCYGKDFENGRELSREIVDEKSTDVDIFFKAIHDSSVINGTYGCKMYEALVTFLARVLELSCGDSR